VYDGAGNRTQIKKTTLPSTVNSNLTTTYDASGLATSAADSVTGESITYTHDLVGDLTKTDSSIAANDWAYGFDAYGRMSCAKQATSCTSGTTRVLPLYDALDRTISSSYNGTTTTNAYRGVGETLSRQQVASTITAYASSPSGTPIAEKASTPYFYLRDPHGDIVGSVTTSAANQTTRSFDAFGKPMATTQASGSQPVLGYQSDLTDPITALVDMGTRTYTPSTGRFTSRDSVSGDASAPMTLNRFAYGLLNPITMFDPTGMRSATFADGGKPDPRSPNDGSNLCHARCTYAPPSDVTPFSESPPVPAPDLADVLGQMLALSVMFEGFPGSPGDPLEGIGKPAPYVPPAGFETAVPTEPTVNVTIGQQRAVLDLMANEPPPGLVDTTGDGFFLYKSDPLGKAPAAPENLTTIDQRLAGRVWTRELNDEFIAQIEGPVKLGSNVTAYAVMGRPGYVGSSYAREIYELVQRGYSPVQVDGELWLTPPMQVNLM
jgi:RHS repeat-associated protein